MPITRIHVPLRRRLRSSLLCQALMLAAAWQAGQFLVRLTGIPVPGSIVGMGLMLALLMSGHVRLLTIKKGSDFLLAQMLLFFIPAVLAVMEHPEFLGWTGVKILLVILAGTLIVMGSTAWTVELCFRWRQRHDSRLHDSPPLEATP